MGIQTLSCQAGLRGQTGSGLIWLKRGFPDGKKGYSFDSYWEAQFSLVGLLNLSNMQWVAKVLSGTTKANAFTLISPSEDKTCWWGLQEKFCKVVQDAFRGSEAGKDFAQK